MYLDVRMVDRLHGSISSHIGEWFPCYPLSSELSLADFLSLFHCLFDLELFFYILVLFVCCSMIH